MSRLRALLRLEDKLAAEDRRLARLSGPPVGRIASNALLIALAAHAVVLLLPTLRTGASLPPSSPAPDFPRVWRFSPVSSGSFVEVVASASPGSSASPGVSVEPVPEPSPDLSVTDDTGDIEAVIPVPDEPQLSFDPGPPAGAETDPAPALVRSVPPVYPAAAKALGATGRVTVRLDVLPDGSVENAAVLECSRPRLGFEGAALDAARQWRYAADLTRAAARPVVVTIEFKRQDRGP